MAARQMLSKKELCRRLEKKGAAQEAAAETADWLEELGAVDDAAFAGVIARHYGALGYGARRVQQELQRRGIPRELWEEALRQLPPPQEASASAMAMASTSAVHRFIAFIFDLLTFLFSFSIHGRFP